MVNKSQINYRVIEVHEITEEMVEAGVMALDFGYGVSAEECLVRDIYLAMAAYHPDMLPHVDHQTTCD